MMTFTPRDLFQAARATGRIYPPTQAAEIVSAELVEAPDHVAVALRLDHGSQVIRRERITKSTETGAVISASVSWFPGTFMEHAPALLSTERIPQGTPQYIASLSGKALRLGRDEFSAGRALLNEVADFGIAPGTPVLRGRNWVHDIEGNIIEYGESVTYADRWVAYEYLMDN